jgi:hypothetical protein
MIRRMASCACGRVRIEAAGEPILSAVCCCKDCQAGGRQIEALPHAAPIRDDVGGTPYLTYRNDRLTCVAGEDLLTGMKLKDDAPTTRFVATCCNSGMYLKFAPGWWTSVYRARVAENAPPPTMRTNGASLPAGAAITDAIPTYPGFPPALFLRLLGARIAMALGR